MKYAITMIAIFFAAAIANAGQPSELQQVAELYESATQPAAMNSFDPAFKYTNMVCTSFAAEKPRVAQNKAPLKRFQKDGGEVLLSSVYESEKLQNYLADKLARTTTQVNSTELVSVTTAADRSAEKISARLNSDYVVIKETKVQGQQEILLLYTFCWRK